LREARNEIDALGADIVAVGRQADYQARALDESEGYGFELLLDPEGNLTDRLEMGGFVAWKWLLPTTWWKYVSGFTRKGQGRPFLSTLLAQPGAVITDPTGQVVWAHRGEVVGDYPPVSRVTEALRTLTQ
jgi:peroxiredoxin